MKPQNFQRDRFLLLAAALMLVNIGGWIWVRGDLRRIACAEDACPADGVEMIDGASESAPLPLGIARLGQSALSTNRLLTIACQFHASVNWKSFASRTRLSTEAGPVAWHFVDPPQGRQGWIQTDVPIPGDRITMTIEPGVQSTDTRFTATTVRTETLLAVSAEFRFSGAASVTPSFGQPEIHLDFTQTADVQQALPLITCDPPVRFTAVPQRWGSGLTLQGDFAIGQTYTVVLSPKLRSTRGHRLDIEVRRAVFIRERPPAIQIAVAGRYLAPAGALIVPVTAVNAPEIVSSLAPVLPQNIVQFAMREAGGYEDWYGYGSSLDGAASAALTGRAALRTNQLSTARNVEGRLSLRLRDYLPPEAAKGVFLLTLTAEKVRSEQRLVCISDIGLGVRIEPAAVHVWTTALGAGRAASGLEVMLYGRNNQLIDTAVTETTGLAKLVFDPVHDAPFLIVAQNPADRDMTFLPLTDATAVAQPAAASRGYPAQTGCEAYLFTERELYRHGEKAFLQALLRQADGFAPKPFPVVLKVLKPDGRLFSQSTLLADARGAITTEVTFPEYLPSGTYRLQLALPGDNGAVLGSQAVMLEAFVPPQIRVNLRPLPASLRSGEVLSCTLVSEHLFGKPAAGLQAEVGLSYRPLNFTPPGWEDYRFGDPERKVSLPGTVAPRQRLSDEGQATFDLTLPAGVQPPSRLQAIVQGTVFEMGGRSVTARGTVAVDPYPFYIGVKAPASGVARPGQAMTLRWATVRPDGTRATNALPLTATVEQVTWVSSLRREDSAAYVWSSEIVRTPVLSGTTAGAGGDDGSFTFTAPNAGDYEITFADPVSKAATRWCFTTDDEGQSQGSRDRENPDHVELVFDKEIYAPGDVARMQIRAPFAGEAWVTLQRDTLIESRLVTLTKNTAEVQWTITEDLAPNAEVAVSVVRPAVAESVWSAHRASGLAPLRVQPPDRRLAVGVVPPAEVWRPYETLPVRIQVKDHAGAAVTNGALTLLAVDEGVCMLTDFQTPDPFAHFMAVRAGRLAFHDLYRQLMPITDEKLLGAASHTAGDAAAELLKRLNPIAARRFKPVALWRANVPLDPSGETTVPLALPEFAGELRLMAIAWDARATGSAASSIKIRRKLVVQPDLPRVLAPLDRTLLTVALHNESGEACEVTAGVKTEGPLTCAVGRQGLTLAAGESRTLLIPLEATEASGTSRTTLVVEGAGERYAETLELAVRPVHAWQSTTEYAKVPPGGTQAFAPPENVVASSVSQTFACSARPTVNLLGALEYVTEYPHGCLEQTVSSAFPLLTLRKQAAPVVPPSNTLAQEAPDRIRAALTRVLAMQRYNGFALWPDVRESDRFGSVYAAHFLVEAEAAGYPVGRQTMREVTGMLSNLDGYEPEVLQAYASLVLAIAGKPDFARMSKLLESEATLSAEARFLLGRALMRAGETASGRRIIEATGQPGDLREAAFGTLAWLEIDPAAPQTAACCQEIQRSRRRSGHWGNTQNNALALLALGEYARYAVSTPQPIQPVFLWRGGRFAAGPTNEVSWRPAASVAQQGLVLTNAGPEAIYVARRILAVPTAAALADVDAGLKVRRAWLDRDGNSIDRSRWVRGDLIIVQISLEAPEREGGDWVVEDLLPACLEIEDGNLARGGMLGWVAPDSANWVLHREVRDDRLLLYAKGVDGLVRFHYAARVVSSGVFTVPPITASDMYAPERMSRHGEGRVTVTAP